MARDEIIYRSILENMKDGVMTVGADGRIMTFNSAAESILSLKRDEVLQRSFGEVFFTREGNDEFNQTVLNAVYESEKVHNSIVTYNTGEKILTLAVTTSFLPSQEAGVKKEMAVIVVFNDITEMERLRDAELQLTEELKKRHKELQNSYLQLEETNESLKAALKKVQTARVLATVFVILLFLSIGFYLWKGAVRLPGTQKTQREEKGVPVFFIVAPVQLSESISLKGALKPVKVVSVTSPFNGTVAERFFEYGAAVKKGDLLLKMDPSELQLKHREARIAFIKAQEKLREVENWEKSDEVAKANRSISKAKLSLEAQKKTLEETEALYKKGIVPATEYESAKQQYVNAQMDYESALSELKSVQAKGGEDNLNIAKFEFDNAKQKLKELDIQLGQINVYAPVSGTIILAEAGEEGKKAKTVEKGVTFPQGEMLLSIGDTAGFAVTTSVDETEVVKIREGQQVKITGDAFTGVLEGKVSGISSQAKTAEGGRMGVSFALTVAIEEIPPEIREKIRLGMSAVMDVLILNKPDALLVPIHAVQVEGNDRFVTLKDKKTGEQKKVKVETGITTLDSVEIIKGLNIGDEILQ